MTLQQTITRLRELLAKATPVRDELKLRSRDGEDHYQLIGVPCGFPVATFADVADAEFDLVARQTIPDLIDRLSCPAGDVVEGAVQAFIDKADELHGDNRGDPRAHLDPHEFDQFKQCIAAALATLPPEPHQMREALEPFASRANCEPDSMPDHHTVGVTIGDCRRAAQALETDRSQP